MSNNDDDNTDFYIFHAMVIAEESTFAQLLANIRACFCERLESSHGGSQSNREKVGKEKMARRERMGKGTDRRKKNSTTPLLAFA